VGFHQGQDGSRGHGCIDGVTTGLKHGETGFAGKGLAGGDDAVWGEQRGAFGDHGRRRRFS
jgi:hypothetical protein